MRFSFVVALAVCMLLGWCVTAVAESQLPLPYRIVSFHRGRANKDLIRRAAELGFNGVMFQLEGDNMKSLREFAERDKAQGYVELCHKLGMQVTLWVHELSSLPLETDPNHPGPITIDNNKLWKMLDDRYEYVLGKLVPNVDGLVLTVVETQINMTDTPMMLKLVGILRDKCRKYGKSFTVRTFVWHPDEFYGVMNCVKQLPDDVIIMTKCVPQDWQLRGIDDKAIGAVGDRSQIIEYDVAGEYFLMDTVACCFPDILKRQFDYGLTKNIDGICVRVDRSDAYVLHEPQEVNLWALGMFASGKTRSVDDVWRAWATKRYGADAAEGVIRALKPTQQVMEEILNFGPFSFGDTRSFPPNGDRDAAKTNWANWRWDEAYVPVYEKAKNGDPAFTRKVIAQKEDAKLLAQKCLDELERAKDKLDATDYELLRCKLANNQIQLAYRAPMMIAYLKYRRLLNVTDSDRKRRLAAEIREQLAAITKVATATYPPKGELERLGRRMISGGPRWFDPAKILEWVTKMESLLQAQGV